MYWFNRIIIITCHDDDDDVKVFYWRTGCCTQTGLNYFNYFKNYIRFKYMYIYIVHFAIKCDGIKLSKKYNFFYGFYLTYDWRKRNIWWWCVVDWENIENIWFRLNLIYIFAFLNLFSINCYLLGRAEIIAEIGKRSQELHFLEIYLIFFASF